VAVEQGASETVKSAEATLTGVGVLGTTVGFHAVQDVKVASGSYFTQAQVDSKVKVAVLGSTLAQSLFGSSDPIGQYVTAGTTQLAVIGVLAPRGSVGGTTMMLACTRRSPWVFRSSPPEFARFLETGQAIYVKIDSPNP
jgi:putative ABC transport system permease protein